MLYNKKIKSILSLSILTFQNVVFSVPSAFSNGETLFLEELENNYAHNAPMMCEYYFNHPDSFKKILIFRIEFLSFKIIEVMNSLKNKDFKSNSKINVERLKESICYKNTNLEMLKKIFASCVDNERSIKDYSSFASLLGRMFDSLKELVYNLKDEKRNTIEAKIEKYRDEFYILVMDPILYTVKYSKDHNFEL